MPIKMSCPECDKEYNLADTMEGKTVKCKGCGNSFTVDSADDASTAVAAKPSNGKAKPSATATRVAKPSVKKRAADDDDDDDEEDDEEEAPQKKGGMGKWLLIGGGLVAVMMLLVCGGVGIGGFLWWKSSSNSDTATTTTDKPNDNTDRDKSKPPDNQQPPPAAPKKFTLADYQQIKGGMTIAQVENILGQPWTKIPTGGDNKTIVSAWVSATGSVDVTYYDGKVQSWSAVFDGKPYPRNTDPTVGPGTNPMSTSRITLDNFNKIKGGMNPTEMFGILGIPTQPSAKPDATAVTFVSDRGLTQVWQSGQDNITVNFTPDFKAAYWTASIGGQSQTKSDPAYAVKSPMTTPGLTKENYNKIKGGESEQQIKDLFGGEPSFPNPRGADQESAKYDNPSFVTWQYPPGAFRNTSVTVAFCNGKAAHWSGTIDGMQMEAKTNQQFVVLKGNNPNANIQVTKANFDKITQGMPGAAVAQLLGQPSFQGQLVVVNATRTTLAHTKQEVKWTDGQGGEISVHFINNLVSEKSNNGRLK